MSRLAGKTALITGASRGFGRATAALFACEGADVVLNYRSAESEARSMADEIQQLGRKAILVQGDIARPEDVQRVHDGIGDSRRRAYRPTFTQTFRAECIAGRRRARFANHKPR